MHWEAVEYFLINGTMIAFVGFLLKHELNDIKARIVRLENIFLHSSDYKESSKNRWAALTVFILGSLIASSSFAATEVNGAAVGAPSSTEILCQSPKFCPRVVAPDWSTNGSTMYGTDPTCRKSIDGGRNWSACTTQPSATNSNISITVASNGAVLWAGNDALGTVYNIRRSTNGSTSWSTVFTTATTAINTPSTSTIKCAQTTSTCLAFYISAGNTIQHLTSTDNGATWSAGATIGTSSAGHATFAISLDGQHAIAPPGTANGTTFRAILYNSGSWSTSLVWPTSTGGSCSGPYIVLTFNRALCNDTTLGTNITTREENGVVQNTFNLSSRFAGGTLPLLAGTPSMFSSNVVLVATNNTGSTNVWISHDSGNTWVTDAVLTETILAPYDSFSLDNCVYFSYLASGLNGRLTKICP